MPPSYRAGQQFYDAAVDALDRQGQAGDLTLKLDTYLERWVTGIETVPATRLPARPARAQAGVTRRVPWSERRIDGPRSGRPSEYALPRHAQCGEPCPSARESALVPSARSLPACPSTSGRGPSASTAGRRVMAHARARRRAGPGAAPLPTPASA